jgi:hypothetical protein
VPIEEFEVLIVGAGVSRPACRRCRQRRPPVTLLQRLPSYFFSVATRDR